MSLPSKITPDNIKEAIVEVRYDSNTTFEVLIGIFFQAFDDSWFYTTRPYQSKASPLPTVRQNVSQEVTLRIGSESLFYNGKINIRVLPGSFVFSCLNEYIGWAAYRPEIEKALRIVSSTGVIANWSRVGLRYISEYPGKDLKDCLKFSFSFGMPEIASETMAFRSEFNYKEVKVILNLSSRVPVAIQPAPGAPINIIPTSITDIDVIRDGLRTNKVEDLLNIIENCHESEKELYFGMIEEKFLTTLKPEY